LLTMGPVRAADYFRRPDRTHCEQGHRYPFITLLYSQSLLQGIQVLGIEYGRQNAPVDRPVSFHGIRTDISRIRNLLGKYNDLDSVHLILAFEVANITIKPYRKTDETEFHLCRSKDI